MFPFLFPKRSNIASGLNETNVPSIVVNAKCQGRKKELRVLLEEIGNKEQHKHSILTFSGVSLLNKLLHILPECVVL